ncbi:MAG: hypothetical protein LUB59_04825 [Candidatus Gastranaerophilales bacterium]|nr:hypothetical protein [Candidatus Gastranaerophilales bacterium]
MENKEKFLKVKEILRSAGYPCNVWLKYDKERLYFDLDALYKAAEFEVWHYKTGNISYCEHYGEKISNYAARNITNIFGKGDVFYDFTEKKICTKGYTKSDFRDRYSYLDIAIDTLAEEVEKALETIEKEEVA